MAKYLNNSIPAMELAQNPANKIMEQIDHLDISNLPLPRNLYLPRLNSHGFDLNEMDCIENLMSKVNKLSELSFHAHSISPHKPLKNLPIEITSKCKEKTIVISYIILLNILLIVDRLPQKLTSVYVF